MVTDFLLLSYSDSGPAIQLPPAVVGDDSRASLMEAIRKAGGSSKAGDR